ncbi:MAG TPA: DUF4440 domain-containing protein [Burkholderiaceae bacterium]
MNPQQANTPELAAVLEQLQRREPIFHRPEFGTTRADFDAMMEPEFREVGASGRHYSRDHVLDVLEARHASPHEDHWCTEGFHCSEIAPDNYLLTYTLHQGERVTRRATLWRRHGSEWKIVYHQGTIVAG